MAAPDRPTIEARKNGPLVVKGVDRIAFSDGTEIPGKPVMALCRCGHSRNKPFCDGTHQKVGFKDDPGKPAGKDKVYSFEGSETTVTFNPRLCAHAAECGRIARNVFDAGQRPWIRPDNGTREEIEAVVAACPSGALKLGAADAAGPDLFPTRAAVTVQKDGPYWILGIDPPAPVRGIGMSDRKYVLCRCGLSGAKPFCDGAHRDRGWRETD